MLNRLWRTFGIRILTFSLVTKKYLFLHSRAQKAVHDCFLGFLRLQGLTENGVSDLWMCFISQYLGILPP